MEGRAPRSLSRVLEIAHPEKLSGLRPVKFEQLEARVHLNTLTWPYSRQTVLIELTGKGVIRPSGRKGRPDKLSALWLS